MATLGVAMIGCGGIALQNHLPGFALCPDTKVVALCDANPATLARAATDTGITTTSTDWREIVTRDDVHAVVIATPNVFHAPIAIAATGAGKHVLSEKPIAMNYAEALRMLDAANRANVRHMTAFTYRFVPAMRYMHHLVSKGDIGKPHHFRASRFQDWGDRDLGWRQEKKMAGTGEIGDMLSHRIDYGHLLIGPIARLVARTRRFVDNRKGHASDLEDWVSVIADFENGNTTGVLESTKLASGRGEGLYGQDVCEVNGSEGTIAYTTQKPLELRIGKLGATDLQPLEIPKEFHVYPGSPRNPADGDPVKTFRYDQNFEFVAAIRDQRPCRPSFADGARAQGVMDAIVQSDAEGRWVDVPKLG
jgi:predicted dehydrogenase